MTVLELGQCPVLVLSTTPFHSTPPQTSSCGSPGQCLLPLSIFTCLLAHFGFLDSSLHLAILPTLLSSFLPVSTTVWKNATVISLESSPILWMLLKLTHSDNTTSSWSPASPGLFRPAWSSSCTSLGLSPATTISYYFPTSLLIPLSAAELDSCFKKREKPSELPHIPPSPPHPSSCTPIFNSFSGNLQGVLFGRPIPPRFWLPFPFTSYRVSF